MADFYDPSVQGLFALGSGLLAAGGPQRFPVSVGQAFGQGGLAAIQAMQQARQQQIQLEDSRLRRDLLAQEILKYKSDLANQQASQADINAVDQFAAGSFPGSAPVDTSVPANGMMFGWGPLSPPQQGFNPMQAATGLAEGASTLGVNGISRPGFDLRGGLNVPREAQPRPGPVQFPGIDVMHVTGTSAGAQPGEAALTTADVGVKPTAKPWDLLRDRADQLEGNLAQYKTAAGKKYAIEQADRLRKQADAIEGRYSYKESKIPGVYLDHAGNQFVSIKSAGGGFAWQQISSEQARNIAEEQARHPSAMYERAFAGLLEKQQIVDSGGKLTPKQELEAQVQRAILEQKRPAVDPNTGQIYFSQPVVVPDSISVGLGKGGRQTAGPVNALPPLESGRKAPGEAEMKVISESQALGETLKDMQSLYNPDWVGPIAGRAGSVGGATVGLSPERSKFIAKLNTFRNRMIKFITGAQMSEVETTRIKKEIPGENDPPSTFEAKLQSSIENIKYVQSAYQENLRQSGRVPIGATKQQSKPKSKTFRLDDGSGVTGILDPQTGKYYVIRGGKKFWIEE